MITKPRSSRTARSHKLWIAASVVRHDEQGSALFAEFADTVEALVLKISVPHRQRLIDDQDIRTNRRGDGKSQPHLHTAGIGAQRLVDVVTNFGESLDFRHEFANPISEQPINLAAHVNVLPAGEIGMKAHAQFQQGSNTSA